MKKTLLKPVSIRLTKDILETAKQQAEIQGMTTAQYLRKLIMDGLDAEEASSPQFSKKEKIEFQSVLETLLMVRSLITKTLGTDDSEKIFSDVRELTIQKLKEILGK